MFALFDENMRELTDQLAYDKMKKQLGVRKKPRANKASKMDGSQYDGDTKS